VSESTVILTEQLERSSDKAPHKAKDGNGKVWIRWDQDWSPLLGKKVKLVYEDKSREYNGRTFTDSIVSEAHEVSENGDAPALGTGEYVSAQKPPIEARRIFCSTAANNASQLTAILVQQQTKQEVTPELVRAAWDAMFDHIFGRLIRQGNAFVDELDINF
jgi:hypothetical protein